MHEFGRPAFFGKSMEKVCCASAGPGQASVVSPIATHGSSMIRIRRVVAYMDLFLPLASRIRYDLPKILGRRPLGTHGTMVHQTNGRSAPFTTTGVTRASGLPRRRAAGYIILEIEYSRFGLTKWTRSTKPSSRDLQVLSPIMVIPPDWCFRQ